MILKEIVNELEYTLLQGTLDQKVDAVVYDSRKATKNTVFVAMSGSYVDGHDFISSVIENGCTMIVTEKEVPLVEGVTYLKVDNSRQALALISNAFFKYPSRSLTVIGVTGTTGKTTSTLMIKSILESAGKKVGAIGTNGVYIGDIHEETNNTTPESHELARLMRLMVLQGCEYCVMEVSSQAFKMHRVDGIDFDYGIFTNLSPDHIGPNEHASFEEYRDCKKQLFKLCKVGLFNKDDPHYEEMIEGATCDIKTFSIKSDATLYADQIDLYQEASHMGIRFSTKGLIEDIYTLDIPGRFNVYNALCAIMICVLNDIENDDIRYAISHCKIEGRGQVMNVSDDYAVIIDFAHNGAAFDSILTTVEEYNPNRIITVFGMPGRRSKVRRVESGEMIKKHNVYAVLTADDPRDESVLDISNEIIEAMQPYDEKYYTIIEDRKEAIYHTLDQAQKGDCILILGKGHETHQVYANEEKVHYSDIETVNEYIEERK